MLVDPVGARIRQRLHSKKVGCNALEIVDIYCVELGLGDDVVQLVHVVWALSVRVVWRYQSAVIRCLLRFLCSSMLVRIRREIMLDVPCVGKLSVLS